MLKVENVEVYGWDAAIRGARNPMNSWGKLDSGFTLKEVSKGFMGKVFEIGPNDYKTLKNLCIAGKDHRKWMRMVTVTMDITAPLYWWKEYDTYKVGTVANSCSTMHKIQAKEFTLDDFSHEHLLDCESVGIKEFYEFDCGRKYTPIDSLRDTIKMLNQWRTLYLVNNNKVEWWQIIQLLPSSYNQKRTVQVNYEVLNTMYHARKGHKLDEWHTFNEYIEGLLYSEFITMEFKGDC